MADQARDMCNPSSGASKNCICDVGIARNRVGNQNHQVFFLSSPHKSGRKPSLSNIRREPSAADIEQAEVFWIKQAQKLIKKEIDQKKNGGLKRLAPMVCENGVIVVGDRIKEWNQMSYDNKVIPILPHGHRFSNLFAEMIHNKCHGGVSMTACKIRNRFWITDLTKMLKSIISRCVTCKRERKRLQSQIMAPLPIERLKPGLPWITTGVDYFGPYHVRGEVNKRTTGKAYGVIFNCLTTRAVHIEVAANYSQNGFMQVLRRFVSIRGYPSKMISDAGSQLVSASKELRDVFNTFNNDVLLQFGAQNGMEWEFVPADAPWQNGVTEALVKLVKRAIHLSIGDQRLTFSELQTTFYEAANLVNERPIGKHPTEPEAYLSPNHILLGRATTRVPAGPFKEPTNHGKRFELVQKFIDDFWRRWTRDYSPSLIIRQKWHTENRNHEIGDVVLVQDSNSIP